MTPTEQIEKIRKAAIAANPEIVELKFGCELRDKHGLWSFLDFVGGMKGRRFQVWRPQTGIGSGTREEFEIIGRPIRLADVLIALEDIPGLYESDVPELIFQLIAHYDLRNDSLDSQSDECVEFIGSLLSD